MDKSTHAAIIQLGLLSNLFFGGALMAPATFASQQIGSFSELYEPSAAVQLADGGILVIEDEGDRPIYFTSLMPTKKGPELSSVRAFDIDIAVDDLEGVAKGKDDAIYCITSHSATKKGKRAKARQQLLRLNVQGQEIAQVRQVDNLLPPLRQHLQKSIDLDQDALETVNIEGLTFDSSREHLLLGLREPLHEGKGIIMTLSNPYAIFQGEQQPLFNEHIITLDLEGSGIRSLTYDRHLGRYFLAGEVKNNKGKFRPRVWVWDGAVNHQPVRVKLPKMKGIKNIEGVTTVHYNDANYLLLVCDDGDRKKKQGAHYILIDMEKIAL